MTEQNMKDSVYNSAAVYADELFRKIRHYLDEGLELEDCRELMLLGWTEAVAALMSYEKNIRKE